MAISPEAIAQMQKMILAMGMPPAPNGGQWPMTNGFAPQPAQPPQPLPFSIMGLERGMLGQQPAIGSDTGPEIMPMWGEDRNDFLRTVQAPAVGQPTQADFDAQRGQIDQAQTGRADDMARRQSVLAAMQQPGGLRYSDPQATDPRMPQRTVQAGRIQPTEQETIDKLAAIEGRMNTQMAVPENMRQEQSLDRTGLGDRMARLAAMTQGEQPMAPGVTPAQGDEGAGWDNYRAFQDRELTPQQQANQDARATDLAQRRERVKNRGIARGLQESYGMNPAQAMALGQLEHNGQTGIPEGFGGGGGGMGMAQMFALDPSGRMAQMGVAQQGIQSEDARAQAELQLQRILGEGQLDVSRQGLDAAVADRAAQNERDRMQFEERTGLDRQQHEQVMGQQAQEAARQQAQLDAMTAGNAWNQNPQNPTNQAATAQAGATQAQTDAMKAQQAAVGPPGMDERTAMLWRQSKATGLPIETVEKLAGLAKSRAWTAGWPGTMFSDDHEDFKAYAVANLGLTPEQVESWIIVSGIEPN